MRGDIELIASDLYAAARRLWREVNACDSITPQEEWHVLRAASLMREASDLIDEAAVRLNRMALRASAAAHIEDPLT